MSMPIRIKTVLYEVCDLLGVTDEDMRGPFRNRKILRARRLFVEVTRRVTDASYPKLAAYVSGPGAHPTAWTLHRDYRRDEFKPFMLGSHEVTLGELADRLENKLRPESQAVTSSTPALQCA